MFVPAAMQIYSAQDALRKRATEFTDAERHEFYEALPLATVPEALAYLLGLEVARVILAANPKIYQVGLKPEDLL